MKQLLVILAVLLMATPAWAQRGRGSVPVCATVASVTTDFTCGPKMSTTAQLGAQVVVLDATSATDCAGGGSATALCEWNGTALIAATPPPANGDMLMNDSTDGFFVFRRNESGTVLLVAEDDNATADMLIRGGGVSTTTVGGTQTSSILLITDGGTVTVDGYVQGDVPFLVVTTGTTLTANTVHIATTDAATHTMPACVAANLGEWVTVVVGDVSEAISLDLADASNRFVVSGVDTSTAGHELDSPTAAASSGGASVTLTCLVAEFWHSTAITGVWLDGN